MSTSTPKRTKRKPRHPKKVVALPAPEVARRIAKLRAAFPDTYGVIEVCDALGVTTSNLQYVRGLPEPVRGPSDYDIRASRLWLKLEVDEFAKGYLARRVEREERAAARSAAA